MKTMNKQDNVNNPGHYRQGKIECLDSTDDIMDKLNNLLAVQEKNVYDEYSRGMYNGMELMLCRLERRPPRYLDCGFVYKEANP